MYFGPGYFQYLLFLAPAILLAMYAQMRVRSTYAAAQRMPSNLTGAAAARYILDSAGLQDVAIEQIPGQLSDHYDPRDKVLRLSPEVYQKRTLASVGIAAHEAGHALQDAVSYPALVVRNAAVPVANFGGGISSFLVMMGLGFGMQSLLLAGIALFATVVFFQVVNLPVEFNASNRAKQQLVALGIIDDQGLVEVKRVLNAAALTYVAATLQAVLTLMFYLMRYMHQRD